MKKYIGLAGGVTPEQLVEKKDDISTFFENLDNEFTQWRKKYEEILLDGVTSTGTYFELHHDRSGLCLDVRPLIVSGNGMLRLKFKLRAKLRGDTPQPKGNVMSMGTKDPTKLYSTVYPQIKWGKQDKERASTVWAVQIKAKDVKDFTAEDIIKGLEKEVQSLTGKVFNMRKKQADALLKYLTLHLDCAKWVIKNFPAYIPPEDLTSKKGAIKIIY